MGPTQKLNKAIFLSIIFAASLTQVASDIYTPSIPAIAIALNTELTFVKWTMVSYVFGAAISQLFYGPLSEGIGRKRPIMLGMGIMLIGSFISWYARDIQSLIFARLIQGLGAGACAALWRSVIRDVLSGVELVKFGAYFSIVITFIVPVAPSLGGYFQTYHGWRANFCFMTVYAMVALILLAFYFPETNPHYHKEKLNVQFIKNTFGYLLKSPLFMGITGCTFLCYGALFSSITVFPIFLVHHLSMEPIHFGWFSFLGTGCAYILSATVNKKWVLKLGMQNMMRIGFSVMLFAAISLIIGFMQMGMNVWSISLPIFLFYYGATFIWPNAYALAFTPFGQIAGYAGSLYGFMQISGGAAVCACISFLPDSNPTYLAIVMIGCTGSAWFLLEKCVTPLISNASCQAFQHKLSKF